MYLDNHPFLIALSCQIVTVGDNKSLVIYSRNDIMVLFVNAPTPVLSHLLEDCHIWSLCKIVGLGVIESGSSTKLV